MFLYIVRLRIVVLKLRYSLMLAKCHVLSHFLAEWKLSKWKTFSRGGSDRYWQILLGIGLH